MYPDESTYLGLPVRVLEPVADLFLELIRANTSIGVSFIMLIYLHEKEVQTLGSLEFCLREYILDTEIQFKVSINTISNK